MRIDQVIRDRTLQEIVRAFDNNLKVAHNFAPEGELGQVLMSNGPDAIPSYRSLSAGSLDTYTREEIDALIGYHKHDGSDINSGQVDPSYLGSGVRDGTRFLRDDGVWSPVAPVAWSALTGVPTDFAGFGLDDDLAAALFPYYTAAEVDGLIAAIDFPVDSVFGRIGAVVAAAGDYDAFYYTQAQVDTLLSLLETMDLVDWPAHASGFLENDGAGNYTWTPGGGGVTGTGTTGKMPKWAGASSLDDSALEQVASDTMRLATHLQLEVYSAVNGGISGTDNMRVVAGTGSVILRSGGTDRWKVSSTGHLLAEADNAYDFGANLATRPRTGYFGTSVRVGASAEYGPASIELGSQSVAGPAYIDFHSDGLATDYNARLIKNSGAAGTFVIENSGSHIILAPNGTQRWQFTSGGDFLAIVDNATDIGSSGALRPRTVYIGTSIFVGPSKVLGPRITGWAASTTTVNRGPLSNASILGVVCQVLGTLINDLRTHGMIQT